MDTSYTRSLDNSNAAHGMKLYKAPRSNKVKLGIWDWFDGKLNPQPRLVIVSRIALAVISVLAWYMGLPYDTPRVIEWLYMIFGCGQLVSMILSYICPNVKQLRFLTWCVCLLDLVLLVLFIYLNYNVKMVQYLLLITFIVPGFWLGAKLALKIAAFVTDHIL